MNKNSHFVAADVRRAVAVPERGGIIVGKVLWRRIVGRAATPAAADKLSAVA